jgi:hypothetical protein
VLWAASTIDLLDFVEVADAFDDSVLGHAFSVSFFAKLKTPVIE